VACFFGQPLEAHRLKKTMANNEGRVIFPTQIVPVTGLNMVDNLCAQYPLNTPFYIILHDDTWIDSIEIMRFFQSLHERDRSDSVFCIISFNSAETKPFREQMRIIHAPILYCKILTETDGIRFESKADYHGFVAWKKFLDDVTLNRLRLGLPPRTGRVAFPKMPRSLDPPKIKSKKQQAKNQK